MSPSINKINAGNVIFDQQFLDADVPALKMDNTDLVKLAATQLGISVSSIPPNYIKELRHHTSINPQDINFRLKLQPGQGYGLVTCLETGCAYTPIKLSRAFDLPDGGRQEGVGSLSAFRIHCKSHPTHAANRDRRLGKENTTSQANLASSSRAVPVTGPRQKLISMLDADFNTSGAKLIPSRLEAPFRLPRELDAPGLPPRTSSHPLVIREPIGQQPSRKRPANDPKVFVIDDSSDDDFQILGSSSQAKPSSSPPTKKMKLSPPSPAKVAPTPLATKSSNIAPPPPRTVPQPHRDAVQNAALQLDLLNAKIAAGQRALASLCHKPSGSKSGRNKIQAQETLLLNYDRSKSHYENIIRNSQVPVPTPRTQAIPIPSLATSQPILRTSGLSIDSRDPMWNAMNAVGHTGVGYDTDDEEMPNFTVGLKNYMHIPPSNQDDVKKYLLDACNAEQFDENATVNAALAKLGVKDLYQPLDGMACTLLPHQAIGVAWMLDREKSHKGGILADEMGLGKTVQMIATLCMNRSDDKAVKTTLIIAPLGLLEQWQTEIETKTNDIFDCLIYHGPNKVKSKKELRKYDVVLTTFHTLALECPVDEEKEKKKRKKKAGSDDFISDDEKRTKKQKRGPLLSMTWYRVVLDEAQNIRSSYSYGIADAVTGLTSTYRWCLTGTPITNGLADCFSLLRFLRFRPWDEWTDYNNHIVYLEKKDPNLGSRRLQAILKPCLLRRKKDSELDGKKLIELPPKTITLQGLTFSKEEKEIYDFVKARSQAVFNRFLRAGTVLKNYHVVLVMLLRLRQICCHPYLLAEFGPDPFEIEDIPDPKSKDELSRASASVSSEFVRRVKAKLKEQALARISAEKSADATIEDDECPICYEPLIDAMVTSCGHFFCSGCVDNVLNAPFAEDASEPHKYKADERPCPTCRAAIHPDKIFDRKAFEPTADELRGDDSMDIDSDDLLEIKDLKPGKSRRRTSKKFYEESDLEDLDDFIVRSDEDEEEKDLRKAERLKYKPVNKGKKRVIVTDSEDSEVEDIKPTRKGKARETAVPLVKPKAMPRFLPSTKMIKMMELLEASAKEHPDDKTIIISQWTSCLDLLADYLNEKGFRYVRYQGGMTRQDRDAAVRKFMTDNRTPCMLMSLKAGGVGLNLVRANRIISLDLAWSEAVEAQAFDRAHRLGQMKDVYVDRLVISDSVEEKILAMQDRKKLLADGSLGEGSGSKIGRLNVAQLANLFGLDISGNRI